MKIEKWKNRNLTESDLRRILKDNDEGEYFVELIYSE